MSSTTKCIGAGRTGHEDKSKMEGTKIHYHFDCSQLPKKNPEVRQKFIYAEPEQPNTILFFRKPTLTLEEQSLKVSGLGYGESTLI